MLESEFILHITKLVLGGVTSFFAIFLWSRTRDFALMSIVVGTIFSYIGIVYDLLVSVGVILPVGFQVAGIPAVTLLLVVLPPLFFIYGFISLILRNR